MNEPPGKQLEHGAALLIAVLKPHGFAFDSGSAGDGSGGLFATGRFIRGTRRLALFHRYGLVVVMYGLDGWFVPHSDYLIALGANKHSKFLSTPIEAGLERYHALAFDLKTLCTDFTTGDASTLVAAARNYNDALEVRGKQLNAKAVGDTEKRRLALNAFRNNQYSDVIELMESIIYPELLKSSETRMIEMARSRKDGT